MRPDTWRSDISCAYSSDGLFKMIVFCCFTCSSRQAGTGFQSFPFLQGFIFGFSWASPSHNPELPIILFMLLLHTHSCYAVIAHMCLFVYLDHVVPQLNAVSGNIQYVLVMFLSFKGILVSLRPELADSKRNLQ